MLTFITGVIAGAMAAVVVAYFLYVWVLTYAFRQTFGW